MLKSDHIESGQYPVISKVDRYLRRVGHQGRSAMIVSGEPGLIQFLNFLSRSHPTEGLPVHGCPDLGDAATADRAPGPLAQVVRAHP